MELQDLNPQGLQINNLSETSQPIFGTLKADYIIAKNASMIYGKDGADVIDGVKDKGSNKIYGEQGNDLILGGLTDNLFGGAGDDQLLAKSGDTRLSGNQGKDQFWFNSKNFPTLPNIITDFQRGKDIIGITKFANEFDDLTLVQVGTDTEIQIDGKSLGILNNIKVNSLTEDDFLFDSSELPDVNKRIKQTLYPLDPLSAAEIEKAVEVVKSQKNLTEAALFTTVKLKEPPKKQVLNYKLGNTFRREAFIVVLERTENKVYEGIVDLRTFTLKSWEEIPGAQPEITDVEFEILSDVTKANPQWQAAMEKRGITNFDDVIVDGWAPGRLSEKEQEEGARLIRGLSYVKGDDNNFYGRPIEGVLVTVNLNTKQVEDVIDTGVVPISDDNVALDEKSIGALRPELPPLEISQPDGQGFEINGNEITWDNWSFRYKMDPRNGLVLNQINYNDQESTRPVMYEGSLSEMTVPYADTEETWQFRSAFDVGEYGLGRLSQTMKVNREVPSNAVLLDAIFADDFGEAYTQEDCLGVYERDSGLLWQHSDYVTEDIQGRRGRELVLTNIVTIGNYDYAIDWIFGQDGSIKVETKLTGILLLKGTTAENSEGLGEKDKYGSLVAPNVLAPYHQHFFNFRLDMDVDGLKNSAIEMNLSGVPVDEDNPAGNGFVEKEKLLATETEAIRDLNLKTHRH